MSKTDHDHPVWQLLDKLQMDIANASAKLVELRAHVASLDLAAPTHGQWQPALGVKDPVENIRRQIANHAITDAVDLEAELNAHALTPPERDQLRALIVAAPAQTLTPQQT